MFGVVGRREFTEKHPFDKFLSSLYMFPLGMEVLFVSFITTPFNHLGIFFIENFPFPRFLGLVEMQPTLKFRWLSSGQFSSCLVSLLIDYVVL